MLSHRLRSGKVLDETLYFSLDRQCDVIFLPFQKTAKENIAAGKERKQSTELE